MLPSGRKLLPWGNIIFGPRAATFPVSRGRRCRIVTILQKFPDLKFKYVEEEQPEDFFVPYVWTLVARRIYWNPKSIKLFEPR